MLPSWWKLPFVTTTTRTAIRSVATKNTTAIRYRSGHFGQEQTCTTCVRAVSGTVVRVVVDEGQLIAEEDPIAAIDDSGTEVVVVTQCPASYASSTSSRDAS